MKKLFFTLLLSMLGCLVMATPFKVFEKTYKEKSFSKSIVLDQYVAVDNQSIEDKLIIFNYDRQVKSISHIHIYSESLCLTALNHKSYKLLPDKLGSPICGISSRFRIYQKNINYRYSFAQNCTKKAGYHVLKS